MRWEKSKEKCKNCYNFITHEIDNWNCDYSQKPNKNCNYDPMKNIF